MLEDSSSVWTSKDCGGASSAGAAVASGGNTKATNPSAHTTRPTRRTPAAPKDQYVRITLPHPCLDFYVARMQTKHSASLGGDYYLTVMRRKTLQNLQFE